jgi:hypothetical protein
MGSNNTKISLASISIEKSRVKNHVSDFLKNFIIAFFGIIWLLVWLGLAGIPESMQPGILLVLVKWPVGIRWISVIILTILAVPLFLAEAAWIRGLILSDREWFGGYDNTKHILFTLIARFAVAGLLTIIVIFWTTGGGIAFPRIILAGVIWVRIILVQVLATVMIVWTAIKFENTWSAVIASAFLLALVVVTTLPLI